jgi:sodium pump decarboxylase gamma subunit
MNIDQLLLQSLQLLGLGMGSVFIILSLLIVIINVIAKLVPEVEIAPVTSPTPAISSTNMEHIAAIQAAVHQYRRSRQSNS